jgi:hypothetical protein
MEKHYDRFDFLDWHWPQDPMFFFRDAETLIHSQGGNWIYANCVSKVALDSLISLAGECGQELLFE